MVRMMVLICEFIDWYWFMFGIRFCFLFFGIWSIWLCYNELIKKVFLEEG